MIITCLPQKRQIVYLIYFILTAVSIAVFRPALSAQINIEIEAIDTANIEASTIVRNDDGALAIRHFKIGDLAHGGIVFWVDDSGEHGLVAAESDQSSDIMWGDINVLTGARGGNVIGNDGGGVGAGVMNTQLIIASDPGGTSAAAFTSGLIINDYGDWYMPSKGELRLLITNLWTRQIGDIGPGPYWSSTEGNITSQANWVARNNALQSSKDSNRALRVIRAF